MKVRQARQAKRARPVRKAKVRQIKKEKKRLDILTLIIDQTLKIFSIGIFFIFAYSKEISANSNPRVVLKF